MKFCEKLILLRKRRGMTQEEFSRAVGVSRQSVYKWESGQSYPEAAKLLEIRKLYGVSIDRLLDEAEPLPNPEEKGSERAYTPQQQEHPAPSPAAYAAPMVQERRMQAEAPRTAEREPHQSMHAQQPLRASVAHDRKKKKQSPLMELVGSIFGKRR